MTAIPEQGRFAAPPLVYLVQPSGAEYRVLPEEDLKGRRAPEPDADASRPVAYLFRPVEYQIVPPERLQEWEEMMTERVGLDPSRDDDAGGGAGLRNRLPSVTFCCEGGGISMSCGCDCDEV
jgi:hypothetical protein